MFRKKIKNLSEILDEKTIIKIERLKKRRIPIRLKFSVFITSLIVMIMFFSSYLVFKEQRSQFTKQMVSFGTTILNNLSNNCSIPLLENDEASLNILIEEISKNKDIVYAMVIDKKGVIKVHTDINKVDKEYEPLKDTMELKKDRDLEILKYKEGEAEILDFSMPIEYQKVSIGTIHIGISLETLEKNIGEVKLFVMAITVLFIVIGIGMSFLIGTLFSEPIHKLVEGTREIKNGNFKYIIDITSNDELGDLTLAFNDMADGLRKRLFRIHSANM